MFLSASAMTTDSKFLLNSLCYVLDENDFRVKSRDSKTPIFIQEKLDLTSLGLEWYAIEAKHKIMITFKLKVLDPELFLLNALNTN